MRLPGQEPADRTASMVLPSRALAGSAASKAIEALTLAGLVVLVPRALGVGDYGSFAVALAVATGIATAIPYAVLQTTLVALPGAARAFAHDRAVAESALRRIAALCAVIVVPACVLLALFAEPLLGFALGEGFRAAAEPLQIALAAAALTPLWALATQLAALRERPEAALAGAALGAASFACVAALALPGAEASGAAAAMLAGVVAAAAGTFAALRLGHSDAPARPPTTDVARFVPTPSPPGTP